MRFDVYAVEVNLGSLQTRVRFKVLKSIGEIERVKDDCAVMLEGRYDFNDEDLPAMCEVAYREAMGL